MILHKDRQIYRNALVHIILLGENYDSLYGITHPWSNLLLTYIVAGHMLQWEVIKCLIPIIQVTIKQSYIECTALFPNDFQNRGYKED